jgi:hypothetical protein
MDEEKSILDFDYSKPDGLFSVRTDNKKEIEQALDGDTSYQKAVVDDNQQALQLLDHHKKHLEKKGVNTKGLSDKDVLIDLAKIVQREGKLKEFSSLEQVLKIGQQEANRGDSNLYFTTVPFQGFEKGAYIAGGITASGVGAVGDFTGISTPGSDSIGESLLGKAGRSGGPVKSLRDGTLVQPFTLGFDDGGKLTGKKQSFGSQLQNTADFGLNAVGEVIPTMAAIMGGGFLGGRVAPQAFKYAPEVLQKKIVGRALNKEIKRVTKRTSVMSGSSPLSPYRSALLADKGKAFAALGSEGQKVARAYASAWGNIAGATAASGTMGVGEVYNSLIPYTRLPTSHEDYIPTDDAVGYSFLFGSAIGALDSILPSKVGGKVLQRFYPKKRLSSLSQIDIDRADNMVKKSLIKAMGMGMAVEGATEATQEFLAMTAEKFAKIRQASGAEDGDNHYFGDKKSFAGDLVDSVSFDLTDEEVWQLADAGAMGLIGGGGAGVMLTALDNEIQLPKRLRQRQDNDDAVAQARLRNQATRSDLRKEIEEKAKRQFERQTIEEGNSVVLPNGQQATFLRNVGDGRGLVTYQNEEGKKVEISLPMPLITLNSDLSSNVVTRANRRQAMQEVSASDPVGQSNQLPESEGQTESGSVVDEFKQDAQEKTKEDKSSESDTKEIRLETSKELRETEVELNEQPGTKITKGDLGAYRALRDIYDSDLTTERLIDGSISDGLKKRISTEAYNQWVSNYYDKAETQPGKDAFIEAFRRAHKKIHPQGRPTNGDALAEQTKAEAEKAKVAARDKADQQAQEKETQKQEELKNSRLINLQKNPYKVGEKIKLTSSGANKAVTEFGLPTELSDAEWTIEGIDQENGTVQVSTDGYTIKVGDPRGFGKPIREKSSDKAFREGKSPLSEYHLGDLFYTRGGLLESTFAGNAVLQGSSQKFENNPDWRFWPGVQYIEEEIRRRGVDPKDSNARKEAEKDFLTLGRNYVYIDTSKVKKKPKEVDAYKSENVKSQGKDMESLPEVKEGTYVVQYGSRKSVIVVEENGWKFNKGSLPGGNANRPETIGQLIQRGSYSEYDVSSVRFEDEYIIDVTFDGVSFNYSLKESVVEPIPIDLDESNGVWIFQGEETNLLEEQNHVQVKKRDEITGDQRSEELQNLVDYKGSVSENKKRKDLPGENKTASGNESKAVIAILHEPTGQVFVRSVKAVKKKKILQIFSLKRPKVDSISALPTAHTLNYDNLPSGFKPIEVTAFSARPGKLRINFSSLAEYTNWMDSIQVFETNVADPLNLPRANELLNEYKSDEAVITDEHDLYFETFYEEEGEGGVFFNESEGTLVVKESLGAYIKAEGSRPAWHYLKVDDVVEQLQQSIEPVLRKINDILQDKKRQKSELSDEDLSSVVELLNIGEGVETEDGSPQIDSRLIEQFFSTAQKNGAPVISKQNRKSVAKALVNALYEQKKRQFEVEGAVKQTSDQGENNNGLSNLKSEEKSPSEIAEIDDVIETFEGLDPIEIGRKVFFPSFTLDQLQVVYDLAIEVVDVNSTREDLIEATGAVPEVLSAIPRSSPDQRSTLQTFHEILANVEVPEPELYKYCNCNA